MEKLTLEQRQKIEKWFDEKAQVMGQCPVCRSRNFGLMDHMVAPPIFEANGGLTIGGPAYPMIMIACGHCGHTQFHNAVMIGLLPAAQPAAQPEKDTPAGREADGGE